MSETLFPYYERELVYIRQLAQEFAKQYPAAAGRLLLEANRSGDPHIERLIESFALLAGRVHHKLDDEFPELTTALLSVLYPHYLAPVPSMAILQFQLDPTRGQFPNGFLVEKHSRLQTNPVGTLPCRFRTGNPMTLWPLELTSAQLKPPPFPAGLQPPRKTAAAIRLQFECMGKMTFKQLSLDKLRLYLSGENYIISSLYELIFNHTTQVVFRPTDEGSKLSPLVMSPAKCLSQVGFEPEDALITYPPQSFQGYRLLTEFFTFPQKFQFVDLGGWKQLGQAGFQRSVEVILFLDRTHKALEEWIDGSTFRLGCVPVINLFEQVAEPISLTERRFEYRIVPDVAQPLGTEVFSVDSVVSVNPTTGQSTDYQPFYSFRHGKTRDNQQAFWCAPRRPSGRENDRGTEVFLNLVDRGFDPKLPAESTLVIRTTCTNRNLPNQLQHAGDRLSFGLETARAFEQDRLSENSHPAASPAAARGAYWGLISHLSLNHLSLSDAVEGRAALQEILRLYDFSDPAAGQQQLAEVTRQLIEGITSVRSRRVVGRVQDGLSTGFCRGIEVTVELDEQKYVGTGMFLFASVLERFLGLYASVNSFSQLVAKTAQTESYFKKWPPRTAEQQLL